MKEIPIANGLLRFARNDDLGWGNGCVLTKRH